MNTTTQTTVFTLFLSAYYYVVTTNHTLRI